MSAALHLVITLAICTWAVRPLARARWVWRAPRAAIVLWQTLALTWLLCLVGTFVAVGLSPYGKDIPGAFSRLLAGHVPAGFTVVHTTALVAGSGFFLAVAGVLVLSWVKVLRTRRRHRQVLDLVARRDPAAPGALVLDHPLAVAYCLPGIRGKLVLSSGALESLTADQVAAVLAHERTHVRERHDLVLLPFAAFRWLAPVAAQAVALLVEMRADEGACQASEPRSLATALSRFGTVATPPGTLGMSDLAISARLERIAARSTPLPLVWRWLVVLTGAVLVSTPLSFLVM